MEPVNSGAALTSGKAASLTRASITGLAAVNPPPTAALERGVEPPLTVGRRRRFRAFGGIVDGPRKTELDFDIRGQRGGRE